jgi:hypothetical protein
MPAAKKVAATKKAAAPKKAAGTVKKAAPGGPSSAQDAPGSTKPAPVVPTVRTIPPRPTWDAGESRQTYHRRLADWKRAHRDARRS